jgi:hypothetical protein
MPTDMGNCFLVGYGRWILMMCNEYNDDNEDVDDDGYDADDDDVDDCDYAIYGRWK